MGGRGPFDSSLLNPLAEPALCMAVGEALALGVLEERAVGEILEVGAQVFRDRLADEHTLGSIALGGPDLDLAGVEVNIINIERDRRSQPDPGGQHQVEEDMIASICRAGACSQRGHEPIRLSLG